MRIEEGGEGRQTHGDLLHKEVPEETKCGIGGDKVVTHHLVNGDTLALHFLTRQLETQEGNELHQGALTLGEKQ